MLKPRFQLTKKIPLTLIRKAAGEYVSGRWVEGLETLVPIEVNIQPMKEEELLILPEADRARQWYKVYSDSEIRADKQGVGGYSADEFEFEGDRYKVMKVRHYSMGILNHFRAMAARVELSAK